MKESDYLLPRALYFQTLWFIRRHDELKDKYSEGVWHSVQNDGQPKGTGISDPTARDAMNLVDIGAELQAIEQPLMRVPEAYRQPLLRHIKYHEPFRYAGAKTMKRWRRRYIYWVAQYKGWIE